jgi:hypothetical protein
MQRFLRKKAFFRRRSLKSPGIAKKIEAHLVAQYAQTQIESQVNVGEAQRAALKSYFVTPGSLTFPKDLFIFIST